MSIAEVPDERLADRGPTKKAAAKVAASEKVKGSSGHSKLESSWVRRDRAASVPKDIRRRDKRVAGSDTGLK